MAYTYPRRRIVPKAEGSLLSFLIREVPEAASATFPIGAPLAWSSGYIAEASAAALDISADTNTVIGFAARAGQNGSSAGDYNSEFILAVPGLPFFANFLNDANPHNTTNAIAAADRGANYTMQSDANITEDGGNATWHVADVTTNGCAHMLSFQSDHIPENQANAAGAVVGDLNARVMFTLVDSILAIGV
jgi:hypothetical protein